jgi:hypothetical protein
MGNAPAGGPVKERVRDVIQYVRNVKVRPSAQIKTALSSAAAIQNR